MKALNKRAAGPGLTLAEPPEPAPGANDVKIRIARTSIGGTDLHIESWDSWAAGAINAPLIPGHEFVGHVIEVGGDVSTVTIGGLVSGEGHVVCGHCRDSRVLAFVDTPEKRRSPRHSSSVPNPRLPPLGSFESPSLTDSPCLSSAIGGTDPCM
jgi:NADPH:quinone reductase-like Zn-dependent oxidoreductase